MNLEPSGRKQPKKACVAVEVLIWHNYKGFK